MPKNKSKQRSRNKRRILTEEQTSQAYLMYYNPPLDRPRPTMAYLASLFSVSTNTMFMELNKERERRQVTTSE